MALAKKLFIWLWLSLTLGGCVAQFGKDFSPVAITANFRIGISNTDTALKFLGEPQGMGKAYLPQLGLVDVWEYHFAVASEGDIKQKMLLLFFDKERRVQGYIWYSSL